MIVSPPSELGKKTLQIVGITKTYGDIVALADVDLKVEPGQILALLGRNGAGKTTLLRLAVGQLKADRGRIEVGGLNVATDRARVMEFLGYVPDTPTFFDHLTARALVQMILQLRNLPQVPTWKKVDALAERLELADDLGGYPNAYSLGMKKKLALLLALLHQPKILILDEPTAGLDPHGIQTLLQILKEKQAEGVGVLFSTHLLKQAEDFVDSVAVLDQGKLLIQGSLHSLLDGQFSDHTLQSLFFQLVGRSV